jgi:iron(III) transport system substrate-binding protein
MERLSMNRSIAALAMAGALLASPALAAEGALVLYTSQPQTDAQATIDAFKAEHPEVEISFVRDGTPKIMAKLRAELAAGAPQADLLLIADAVTMEGLKRDDVLMAHEGADVSAYPEGLHDPAKFWFATKLITTGIVYNDAAAEAGSQGPGRHAEPALLGRGPDPYGEPGLQPSRGMGLL